MASTTDLGKWMITNGGLYNPDALYEQLTMVMYDNSTYITLKTVQGITPTDDHVNYQLMAKGFDPTALGSVQAEDTSGVLGEVGGTVSAQDLVDWVVDQAATKLLKISDLVSVQTNDATKGVSAALAYAMGQKLDQLDSDITQNNTISEIKIDIEFNSGISLASGQMKKMGKIIVLTLDITGNFASGETVIGTLKNNLPITSTTTGGRSVDSSGKVSAMSSVILNSGLIRTHCLNNAKNLLFSFMYITK